MVFTKACANKLFIINYDLHQVAAASLHVFYKDARAKFPKSTSLNPLHVEFSTLIYNIIYHCQIHCDTLV